jgi:hypothetical protein
VQATLQTFSGTKPVDGSCSVYLVELLKYFGMSAMPRDFTDLRTCSGTLRELTLLKNIGTQKRSRNRKFEELVLKGTLRFVFLE